MADENIDREFEEIFSSADIVDITATTKIEALKELAQAIGKSDKVTNPEEFENAIFEREKQLSTGVGIGVAIPHVKISSVTDFVAIIGRSHRGIDFNAIDNKPVHIIVMIGASDKQSSDYLKILARIVLRLKEKDIRRKMMFARNSEEIRKLFLSKPI